MSDTYQAIYDAAYAKLRNCDVGAAIQAAAHLDASHAIELIRQEFCIAGNEMQRPSVLYRPQIMRYEDQWCAFYGKDMDSGVCGFGATPADAMQAFDRAWAQRVGRVTASGDRMQQRGDGQ
jgi:hypothetical protein